MEQEQTESSKMRERLASEPENAPVTAEDVDILTSHKICMLTVMAWAGWSGIGLPSVRQLDLARKIFPELFALPKCPLDEFVWNHFADCMVIWAWPKDMVALGTDAQHPDEMGVGHAQSYLTNTYRDSPTVGCFRYFKSCFVPSKLKLSDKPKYRRPTVLLNLDGEFADAMSNNNEEKLHVMISHMTRDPNIRTAMITTYAWLAEHRRTIQREIKRLQ